YNYKNPVRWDVVNTGNPDDNPTIQFTTGNPGLDHLTFLYIHIDWHFEVGFTIVFAETMKKWNATIHPTQQWDQLCPKYNDTL
ncbi:hypothetical protein EDD18DRAFT_1079101, partial [Armillaria luteobubalina]